MNHLIKAWNSNSRIIRKVEYLKFGTSLKLLPLVREPNLLDLLAQTTFIRASNIYVPLPLQHFTAGKGASSYLEKAPTQKAAAEPRSLSLRWQEAHLLLDCEFCLLQSAYFERAMICWRQPTRMGCKTSKARQARLAYCFIEWFKNKNSLSRTAMKGTLW